MTAVYQLRNKKSFRLWEYANFHHQSKNDQTILLDLLDTYWDYPLQDIWSDFPIHIQINEDTLHFPFANLRLFLPDVLLVDGSAKSSLEKILFPYGEFLPIYNLEQEIYCYHLLNKIPALDLENSVVRYYQSSGRIGNISKYAFHQDLVQNQYIFQTPETKRRLFVTDRFLELIDDYQLNGLRFNLIWQA